MSVKRLLLGLFLFFAAIVSVAVGVFLLGLSCLPVGNPLGGWLHGGGWRDG